MTIIISALALVGFFSFICHDIRSSKGNYSKRFVIRILSAITGILSVLSLNIFFHPCTLADLGTGMTAVTAILLLFPCSYEKPEQSLRTATVLSVSMLALILFFWRFPSTGGFKSARNFALMSECIIVIFYFNLACARKRSSLVRALFRSNAVWHNLEDYSRLLYSVIFLCISLMVLMSVSMPGNAGLVMGMTALALMLALYTLLYFKALTGRTFVMKRAVEEKIKEMIKGNLRTSYVEKIEEDKKMNNLYKRILLYMTENKPYLDPTFDMHTLAEKLFSNKYYVSKTINILSGRNFRQFVNYYRVQHAIDLFKSDPKLKVSEVAEFCGFNSPVSFNMAFKVNTGKTPSAWVQDYVSGADFF